MNIKSSRQWRSKTMTSKFASLTSSSKKLLKTRPHKTQKGRRRWKRSCLLFTWKRKNWENFKKRKSWHKLWKHTFYVEARKKEFVQCIIKQLLDSVFVISRIIKVSVRVISLSLPRPWFFWISQKPHPIIVYYYVFSKFGLITNWPL